MITMMSLIHRKEKIPEECIYAWTSNIRIVTDASDRMISTIWNFINFYPQRHLL